MTCRDAAGFIKLNALRLRVAAKRDRRKPVSRVGDFLALPGFALLERGCGATASLATPEQALKKAMKIVSTHPATLLIL